MCHFTGGVFPNGSVVMNLPAMKEPQESWVPSLGQEDPLEHGTVPTKDRAGMRITPLVVRCP